MRWQMPLLFMYIILGKTGDSAAYVIFAFALYCVHSKLLENLRVGDLMESVKVFGEGL